MWVLFDGGFVSIVEKREDHGKLCVRARVKADLQTFVRIVMKDATPSVMVATLDEIQTTPNGDYRYRIVLPKDWVGIALAHIAMGIDYDNFKNRVMQRQGPLRAGAYHRVWDTLYELQQHPDELGAPDR